MLVQQELLEHLELLGRLAQVEHLEYLVRAVLWEHLGLLGRKARAERLVLQVPLEHQRQH